MDRERIAQGERNAQKTPLIHARKGNLPAAQKTGRVKSSDAKRGSQSEKEA